MSETVLGKILAAKALEVAKRKRLKPLSMFSSRLEPSTRDFKAAVSSPGPSFILEVKKRSPSRGPIRPDLDLPVLLHEYEAHADAISVLTDKVFFGGSRTDLTSAAELTTRPLLRKDFIIDPYQVAEARLHGADAVLLIVAALDDGQLAELAACARGYGLDVLVEVHDRPELDRALSAGADLIGINNRNLKDLTVDLATTEKLSPFVPGDIPVVCESGVSSRLDVRRLAPVADAFLVGSAILAAPDLGARVRELAYGRVKVCGITRKEDAVAALEKGATWFGLVFHGDSPRCVTPSKAAYICGGLEGKAVGVFVDTPPNDMVAVAKKCRLAGVQLHGDSSDSTIIRLKSQLPGTFVTRVVRVCNEAVTLPDTAADYILLDTFDPSMAGGTGRPFAPKLAAELASSIPETFRDRVWLAGGLNPDNAGSAAALGPYALDLSSGVEASPGIKDHDRLERLFAALRQSPGQREMP